MENWERKEREVAREKAQGDEESIKEALEELEAALKE